MFWYAIILIIIALIAWFGYLKPYSHWKKMGVKQTKQWFLFGDIGPVLCRRMTMIEWLNRIYYMHSESKYVGMYQFYLPTLLIRDPELIKQLAVKDFDYFPDHNNFTVSEEIDALWSKNLFALKGQKWRDMRTVLSGSFTSSKIKIMYNLISETSGNFVKYFLNKNQDIIEVEMMSNFTRYTNDVIASTSFGIKVDSLENPNNEFYLMGKEATNFTSFTIMLKFAAMMLFPWLMKMLKIGFFSKRVTKFFNRLINETIRVREEQGIVRPDMINILLEIKKGVKHVEEKEVMDTGFAIVEESPEIAKSQKRQMEITNADIASQAMIFFLAGFDSVATAMSYTCYELAINPDVQEKLRKEIKATLEDCDGNVTYESLLRMKYLDMVVSESLRKWPVNPALDRECVKPYTLDPISPEESSVTLRKTHLLLVPVYNIQRDPKYFSEPEKFIPERFSDENRGNIKPYTYMPFGVGPRACIGSRFALLEVKSILFHLLNNFEIVPVEKTRIPLKMTLSFDMKPEGGFPLGLKRLKSYKEK